MTTFGIVTDNEELGGNTTDLVNRPVAWKPLSYYETPSKFEPGKLDRVLRTRAYGVDAEGKPEDLGIRLVFWASVQNSIEEQTVANDLALGVLKQIPQASNPDRTVYVLATPTAEQIKAFQVAFNGSGSEAQAEEVDEAPF